MIYKDQKTSSEKRSTPRAEEDDEVQRWHPRSQGTRKNLLNSVWKDIPTK